MAVRILLLLSVWSVLAIGAESGTNRPPAAAQAAPPAQTVALLAIDADPTGNTIGPPTDTDSDTTPDTEQTALGTIDECVSIASPATIEVDFVVLGYPSSDPLKAYALALNYDPNVVQVKATITGDAPGTSRTLLSADPQSGPFLSFPISDAGVLVISVADLAPFDPDEDIDGTEASDGFLARLTLDALAEGIIPLTLGPSTSVGGQHGNIPAGKIQGAQIAVGQPCPSEGTPAPASPAPEASPTPTREPTAVGTATPGSTPTPPATPTAAPTAGLTPVPTTQKPVPSPSSVVSPRPTAMPSASAAVTIDALPPTGAAGGGEAGVSVRWLTIGLGLGIAALLAGAAVLAVRRRAR